MYETSSFISLSFQPKYVLRKGIGQSTFQFTNIVEKMSKRESQINSSLSQIASKVKKKASFMSTSMRETHITNINTVSGELFFQLLFESIVPSIG